MSTRLTFGSTANSGMKAYLQKSKKKTYVWCAASFLFGCLVVLIPCLIVIKSNAKDSSHPSTTSQTSTTYSTSTTHSTTTPNPTSTSSPSPGPPGWNASDYLSNSDYYLNLTIHHPFSQEDNLRLDRLSSPRFAPDGSNNAIYLRRQYHMPNCNGSSTTLHWIRLNNSLESTPVQLTRPIWGIHDQQFFWVDQATILFLSNRAPSGLIQLFQLNLPDNITALTDYIEPIQITDFPLSIDNLLVNRQASRLAFSCQVYAKLSIHDTAAQQTAKKTSDSLVYEFDKLFIRHWDEYMTGLRHHPFVVSIARDAKGTFQFTSTPEDVLFGIDSDAPTRPFGDGKSEWSFSASGNSFAFTRQHDETSAVAWSTNLDIYTVNLTTSNIQPVCITCENLAADTDPKYSPTDENVLVYRSQSVPGYESDQFKVKLFNGSNVRTLLDNWDRSIQAITWSNNGQSLFLELGEYADHVIYKLRNVQSPDAEASIVLASGSSHDINPHPKDEETFLYTGQNLTEPTNVWLHLLSTVDQPITKHNKNLLDKMQRSDAEKFTFVGAKNEKVWGWHLPPANVTSQKAPLAFLIHGGPQNSWYNTWGFGWSFQVFAAQGYAVIAINFHGSDSYGQNFTDSITGQYGTLPYEDLQLGLTAALEQYSYIDANRAVALGASYGGFMINWIAGHPEMSQRFRALVNHDGLFDMRGMAYSTDELWFTEHDAGGFTPYDNPEAFEKFNPVNHVANWTQPMLIIQGGRDYRVPDTQSIGAFTALQRRGIPSRLLYMPNENHWTLNPLNSIVWYEKVLDWMHQWTK